MPRKLHHAIALMTLAAACGKPSATPANASRDTGTTATANGTVAPALAADTISDRADAGRILGDTNAKVWVIMASDFQCPYCKMWHDKAFQAILKTYVNTGKVRIAFLNMPLSMHPNAVPASEAAMCAGIQKKFWPMHEALFATQSKWEQLPDPKPVLDSLAKSYGVEMISWRNCMTQHLTRPLIQADHDKAIKANVNSTPTFFVGDKVIASADADVPAAIEAALKGAKKPGSN